MSRPAATKSWAEGTGDSANKPRPAIAFRRLPTTSSSAASRLWRRFAENLPRKRLVVAARTSRPGAAAESRK
ncbi:MAG TPA: hypothetical protein VE078_13280 [Thermoanaerobaculia bacterium]|nr:hypothetical protein [Thermoanaerobaculia bacterium]